MHQPCPLFYNLLEFSFRSGKSFSRCCLCKDIIKPLIVIIVIAECRLMRQKCVVIAEEDQTGSRKLCRYSSKDSRGRHSKQGSLGKTGSESQIKQTSSLELEQHGDDFPYWKSNQSVRRLNSNSIPLETHLTNDHPQSLEIISKKEDEKNKIPSHPQSLEVCIR